MWWQNTSNRSYWCFPEHHCSSTLNNAGFSFPMEMDQVTYIICLIVEDDITDFDIWQDSRCNPGSSSDDNVYLLLYVCKAVQRKVTKTSDKNQNIGKDMVGHDLFIYSRYKSHCCSFFIAMTVCGFFFLWREEAFACPLFSSLTNNSLTQSHAKILYLW